MKKIFLIILAFSLYSCASEGVYVSKEHKKSVNRARKLLDRKLEASQRQYSFHNNQIIIFENNY